MSPEPVIRSRHNPIYKQLRSLLRRDIRRQERAFLVEGPRFIADARRFGAIPRLIALAESHASHLDTSSTPRHLIRILDDDLFATLSDTSTSQGMIGIFPIPETGPPADPSPLVLVAAGIQDPGNLGTLIRSAAGAGASQVIILPGTVDPWAPKTVRAAAGAHFAISVESSTPDLLRTALPRDTIILGADATAETRYDCVDFSGPRAVIIGAEGHGLSEPVRALVDRFVSIPLQHEIESLNAAIAGSIILFEASRQRATVTQSGQIPSN